MLPILNCVLSQILQHLVAPSIALPSPHLVLARLTPKLPVLGFKLAMPNLVSDSQYSGGLTKFAQGTSYRPLP